MSKKDVEGGWVLPLVFVPPCFFFLFPPTGVLVFSLHTGVLFFFCKEDFMVTLEMINNRGQVSFFTVTSDYAESFIKQMQNQNADWLLLSVEYHEEDNNA